MTRIYYLVPASVLLLAVSASAYAADEAQNWLLRIHQAPRSLNYEGTFVYQHGGKIDTMRIFHRATNGVVSERLISLTGPAREVVRNDQEVRCYLPDQKSIFIEQRRLSRKSFINIVPDRLPDLAENYTMTLGHKGRIAGRMAQQLVIRPRDDYRYGFRLWADKDTGLLLRADLTDEKGKLLEQFMFTQLDIGDEIDDSMLQAHTSAEGMVWYRDDEVADGGPTRSWQAAHLPKGFKLSTNVLRRLAKDDRVVRQLVYSDSLAAVSVFIEKLDRSDAADMVDGPTHMGAVNALGKVIDEHHVTVVGEVPAKTIIMIGNSLAPVSSR
jgi:sigma-E factor negative regulatory protein RseB